ncbi:DNA polymerase [Mucilaginibacter sp.]|jgi:DNA polymerase|uniref:DNA polymerase n=1 Tax=Mucilaginibacter sp. TaxID=1882438 RepID=UPI00356571C1
MISFEHILDLDFETWSPTDIKTAGAYKYAEKAEILLMSYSIDEGPVKDVDVYHNGFPENIKKLFTDPRYKKRSHNAPFERSIIFWCLGIYSPPEQWECLQVKASMAGLPMSLDGSTSALGLVDKKDWTGPALIRYFCIPCKPTAANGMRTRNLPEHDMDKWRKFIGYCNQDVVAQIAEAKALSWFKIPPLEHRLWCLDQKCNEQGIRVDMQLIHNAIEMDAIFREALLKEAVEVTGLKNANSVAQIKKWLFEETGDQVKSLSKGAVVKLMDKVESEKAKRVLEIRTLLAKSSIKKYQGMLDMVGHDGRIRGILQFYGAGRTGRDAGRGGIQVQNLPRIYLDEEMLGLARQLVMGKDIDMLDLCFGNLAATLSQLIRTAIVPTIGNKFIVSDYSAIELLVNSWLSGEQWVLNAFKTHGKLYEATASKMFNVPLESIGKSSDLRQRGKVASLALGYQGAVNALITMGALDLGIKEEELKPIVDAWRKANPNIVQFWWDLERAAKITLKHGSSNPVGVKGVRFDYKNKNLLMYLPSGRFLCYHGAHLKEVWISKGRILGYTTGPAKLGAITLSAELIQRIQSLSKEQIEKHTWSETEDQYAYWYDVNDQGQIYLPYLGKVKNTYFKMSDGRSVPYDDLEVILSIQRKELILFWAINQTTKQWALSSTYAGKLAENCVQATARDILMNGVINLEEAGYDVVMRVHDEVVVDSPIGTLDDVNTLMVKPAAWMKGLPLKAAGFVGKYYQK